ncbi:MAG: hypothetical protein DRQ14_07520 [Candidatus Latescibacterota bacterium]|nr:MAG: hypothetical protein DRQ14_07520 [Candidatus Latescibacterota bacterium]
MRPQQISATAEKLQSNFILPRFEKLGHIEAIRPPGPSPSIFPIHKSTHQDRIWWIKLKPYLFLLPFIEPFSW